MKGNQISLKDLLMKYGPNVRLKKVKSLPAASGTTIYDSVSIDEPDGVFVVSLDVEKSVELGLESQVCRKGRYSGNSAAYVTVAEYEVQNGQTLWLQEITWFSDKITTSQWELEIVGDTKFTNELFLVPYTLPVKGKENEKGLKMPSGTKVTVRMKSNGAIPIVADAVISGLVVE